MSRTLSILAVVALCTVGLSAVAVAKTPTPKAGAWWGETSPPGGNDDSAAFIVKGQRMLPKRFGPHWSVIVAPTSFKCNEGLLQLPVKRLRIKKGRFAYHGKVVDAMGNTPTGVTGRLDWTGRFVSRTKVRGTIRLRTKVTPVWHKKAYKFTLKHKRCDTGKLKWAGGLVR